MVKFIIICRQREDLMIPCQIIEMLGLLNLLTFYTVLVSFAKLNDRK